LEKSLGVSEFWVNSLHGQGIKTLGKGLSALAHAPDGLVEAMYCTDVRQFTLSMQWHPEWLTHENPLWIKIYEMYGDACRDFREANGRG
jgi:putative glutamine amidotransferase